MKELVDGLGLSKGFKNMAALRKEIPRSGKIPPDLAEILYHKCCDIMDDLTDMLAKTEKFEADIKNERNNLAIDLGESEDCKEKSVAGKDRYAQSKKEWRELQQKRSDAGVLVNYLDRKRDNFKNRMYNMKATAKNNTDGERATPDQELT